MIKGFPEDDDEKSWQDCENKLLKILIFSEFMLIFNQKNRKLTNFKGFLEDDDEKSWQDCENKLSKIFPETLYSNRGHQIIDQSLPPWW